LNEDDLDVYLILKINLFQVFLLKSGEMKNEGMTYRHSFTDFS